MAEWHRRARDMRAAGNTIAFIARQVGAPEPAVRAFIEKIEDRQPDKPAASGGPLTRR